MPNMIHGGYQLAHMEACSLPEQVATGFSMAIGSMVGAKYEPVLYVGTQVVHGTNHMLICKQTLAVAGAPEHLVKMVLNQNCDGGDIVGSWSIVSIEEIV